MNPRTLVFLLLLNPLSACESAPSTTTAPTTSSAPPASVDSVKGAAPGSVSIKLRKLDKIPDAIDSKGPAAWGWTDANGENIFVVTYTDREGPESEYETTWSRSMVITHDVLRSDGAVVRKRTVKDFVNDCAYDLSLHLKEDSLKTTDLDSDGLAEITFSYFLNCASDVGPVGRKLLLLEDGEKYILRGYTGVEIIGGPVIPSEFKVDRSVARGPKVFREHLIAEWSGSEPKQP